MIFGYARVSTHEQNLDLQIDALVNFGIEAKNIYCDKISSSKSERPQLNQLLSKLREGDTLVVWKLDRLVRSLIDFTQKMTLFNEQGILFKSITEPFIDTTQNSPHSHFFMNMIATMAQFERDLIKERTKAGLVSARIRGRVLGRPQGLSNKNKKKAQRCVKLFKEGILTVDEICEDVGVSRATYYKYLRLEGIEGEIRNYTKQGVNR
ncbi:recombinase family protein [Capnocytophaga canis]|uniref:recombinase family protein n=1 Tax=Capnocytophaga canis TaxID=1848903 RepID=UPI001562DEFF|nr:recombinase family protein [Capnocytophaga canis]